MINLAVETKDLYRAQTAFSQLAELRFLAQLCEAFTPKGQICTAYKECVGRVLGH